MNQVPPMGAKKETTEHDEIRDQRQRRRYRQTGRDNRAGEHRVESADARNGGVILVGGLRLRVGEPQPADVLDSIIADSQADEEFLPVEGNGADLVVGAGGGGRHIKR